MGICDQRREAAEGHRRRDPVGLVDILGHQDRQAEIARRANLAQRNEQRVTQLFPAGPGNT